MNNTKTINIGISDFKNLLQSVKDNYYIDFSNYALSSLKRRVELFLINYHFNNVDELIHKIQDDKKFFQVFLKNTLVESTEMFRDPEFWDEFKSLISKKSKNVTDLKIWLPNCNSGEELYTLLIILDKLKLIENTKVYVTSLSALNEDDIRSASLEMKKMEINSANYERTEEGSNLFEYFKINSYYADFDKGLMQNTKIIQHNIFTDDELDLFDFILFRNNMIYFNQQLRIKSLDILKKSLKTGGLIAVGVKESVSYPSSERDFALVSSSEKIYKKLHTE